MKLCGTRHTHTKACKGNRGIGVRLGGCVNVYIPAVTLSYSTRCFHWGKLGEGCREYLCTTSYNCMSIYNHLNGDVNFLKCHLGNSLGVQQLGLCTFTAEGPVWSLVRELRIPRVAQPPKKQKKCHLPLPQEGLHEPSQSVLSSALNCPSCLTLMIPSLYFRMFLLSLTFA